MLRVKRKIFRINKLSLTYKAILKITFINNENS